MAIKRKTMNLRLVHTTETVLELKKKILNKSGIALHEQKLKYGYRELADANTLASYGISPVDVVHLKVVQRTGVCVCEDCNRMREKITVLIQNFSGDSFTLDVTREDTVLSVKKRIQKLQHIAPRRQRLVLGAQVLADECVLECYNGLDVGMAAALHHDESSVPGGCNLVPLAEPATRIPTLQLMIQTEPDGAFRRLPHVWGRR